MIPADVVAAAIVAACRETGDDPEDVLKSTWLKVPMLNGNRNNVTCKHHPARHYAYHALMAEVEAHKYEIARAVGARDEKSFCTSTNYTVLDRGRLPAKVDWFKVEALQRVREAVRAAVVKHDAGRSAAVFDLAAGRYISAASQELVVCSNDPTAVVGVEFSNEPFDDAPIAAGDRVQHRIYGAGTVEEVSGKKVVVQFDRGSRQRMLAKYFERIRKTETAIADVVRDEASEMVADRVPAVVAGIDTAKAPHLGSLFGSQLPSMRKAATADGYDATADVMGDPSPERSALAGAEPWRPYEERVKHGDVTERFNHHRGSSKSSYR